MNPNNRTRLVGTITREPKSGQSAKGNNWAFSSIKTDAPHGERSAIIDVKAFDDVAADLAAAAEGAHVRLECHLSASKPKEGEGKNWKIDCVVDEVHAE